MEPTGKRIYSNTHLARLQKIALFSALFLFGIFQASNSQTVAEKETLLLHLKDKGFADSPALSPEAIEKRIKRNIPLDALDYPISVNYLRQIQDAGAVIHNHSRWLKTVVVKEVDTEVYARLLQLPFIQKVEKITPAPTKKQFKDKLEFETFDSGFFSSSAYGDAYWQTGMLNGDFLHQEGYSGAGMTIAVFDAGYTNVAPMIEKNLLFGPEGKLLGTRNFIDNTTDVFKLHNHGTAVLSTMATWMPRTYIGTAPNASYYLFITEDVTQESIIEEYNWVAAAEYADSLGVDVFNTSLGYSEFDDSTQNHTYADMNGRTAPISIGAVMAARKGILVITSAGNYGQAPWRYISAPADADSTIAVGAVNFEMKKAGFSSFGPSSDGRIKPEVAAMGLGTVLINHNETPYTGNGTSFSGPVLAGLATCLWQAFPHLNNIAIRELINRSGSQYENPNDSLGYGIPNFFAAFHEQSAKDFPHLFTKNPQPLIRPNPFNNEFFIHWYDETEPEKLEVSIFTITGNRILSENLLPAGKNYFRINLEFRTELPAGLYLVRLRWKDEVWVKKLLKQ